MITLPTEDQIEDAAVERAISDAEDGIPTDEQLEDAEITKLIDRADDPDPNA